MLSPSSPAPRVVLGHWLGSGLLVLCGIGLLVAGLERRTIENWDLVAYVGLLQEVEVLLDDVPPSDRDGEIHRRTYESVEGAVSAAAWQHLSAHPRFARHPDYAWASRVTREPEAFVETLGWYRGRVGFTGLLVLLHRAGLEPVEAVRAVSLTGYAALVALLWLWIGRLATRAGGRPRVGGPWMGALAALGVGASAPLADPARLLTPDLPAAAFLLAGLWALLELRWAFPALALFLVAVLNRPDSALTLLFVLFAAAWTPRLAVRTRRAVLLGSAAAYSLLYLALGRITGHPGWRRLFYYNFRERRVDLEGTTLGWRDYLDAYADIPGELGDMSSPLFLVLGLALWLALRRADRRVPVAYPRLLGALLLAFALRFLLFPVFWDRFWILLDLYVLVVLAAALARPGSELHAPQA